MDTVYWGKRRNLCRCVHASYCNTDNWNINGISDEESAEVGESLQEMIGDDTASYTHFPSNPTFFLVHPVHHSCTF